MVLQIVKAGYDGEVEKHVGHRRHSFPSRFHLDVVEPDL